MANKPLQSITFPDLPDTYTIPQIDTTLSVSGKAADAKATGDELDELKSAIENAGLTDEAKEALLDCFAHVTWDDEHGQDYYDALEEALNNTTWAITNNLTNCATSNAATSVTKGGSYSATITASAGYVMTGATVSITMGGTDITSTAYSNGVISISAVTGALVITISAAASAATLVSISAVYTQSGTVYTTDTLDSLKQNLVVTATYDDSSTSIVPATDYTLSGALAEGTQTITVSYGGETDTFTVNCTVKGYLYHFNQSLLSSGSEEFGLIGNAVYSAGRLGTDYAYSHIIPTSGTSSSDTQYGLYAKNIVNNIDFGSDFTFSCWAATQINKYAHLIDYTYNGNSSTVPNPRYFSSATAVESGWTVSNDGSSKGSEGFLMGMTTTAGIILRFMNAATTAASLLKITPPSSFDSTAWHHYAVTRKGNTVRVFIDGAVIVEATASQSTIYDAQQIAISANWSTENAIKQMPNGEKIQDFYLTDWCKWEAAFDASAITY